MASTPTWSPSAPAPFVQVATVADLEALGEDARVELIEGELVPKAAPDGPHSLAQGSLAFLLGPYFHRSRQPNGQGGWWLLSAVRILFEGHDVYLPDFAGWRRERLPAVPTSKPIEVRPDWVCEVLSTNAQHDLDTKLRVYHRSGVPHYWVISPQNELLTVYRHQEEGYLTVLTARRGRRVRAEPFDAIEWNVGCLFGDDAEAAFVSAPKSG